MKLTLLMQGVEEMRHSGQPRLAMETTFLKIIGSSEVVPVATLLSRLDMLLAGEVRQDGNQAGEGTGELVSSTAKKKQPQSPVVDQKIESKQVVAANGQPEEPARPLEPLASTGQVKTEQKVPGEGVSPDEPSATPTELEIGSGEKSAPRIEPHQRSVRRDWMDFIAYVRDRSVWMAQDLQRADSVKELGHELLLDYADPANCTLLRKDDTKKKLTEFVLDFFQKELALRFVLPDQNSEVAPEGSDSPLKERHLLANDPLVLMTAEIFNGQIGDIRVGPRFR
jgi:DNA polymerase-3 subunit gamma/tau